VSGGKGGVSAIMSVSMKQHRVPGPTVSAWRPPGLDSVLLVVTPSTSKPHVPPIPSSSVRGVTSVRGVKPCFRFALTLQVPENRLQGLTPRCAA
jgi:hypothetical protein